MKCRHVLVNVEDLDKIRALIHRDRAYKVIVTELIDQVMHPKPERKVIYTVPPNKALVIFVNPYMPEGDEPKDVDANAWYPSKFARAGIKFEWVQVTYL